MVPGHCRKKRPWRTNAKKNATHRVINGINPIRRTWKAKTRNPRKRNTSRQNWNQILDEFYDETVSKTTVFPRFLSRHVCIVRWLKYSLSPIQDGIAGTYVLFYSVIIRTCRMKPEIFHRFQKYTAFLLSLPVKMADNFTSRPGPSSVGLGPRPLRGAPTQNDFEKHKKSVTE